MMIIRTHGRNSDCGRKGGRHLKQCAVALLLFGIWFGVGVLPAPAGGGIFEIFDDSFESPVMSGRLEMEVPGWWRSNSRVGLWNEDSGTMTTPHGNQALWIWHDRYATTTNITDTMVVGATYTLSFNVAAESALGGIQYRAELLAGTNVLAYSDGGPVGSSDFSATTGSVNFVSTTNSPGLGEALGIRLRYVSGDWQYVIGFDNVRLVADEPAEWGRTLFYGK
ncbi:MAG: hypothetical protein ACI856_001464 [Kiritimatiellia bacterium]|jgi:hypothetical protein